MKTLPLFMLSLCLFLSPAHASTEENTLPENDSLELSIETSSTTSTEPMALVSGEVTLLGRGWENRKTGDYLALACTDKTTEATSTEPCKQFRFIYFNAEIKATAYIGNTFKIGIDTKNIKAWGKKFGKSFRHWKYETYSRGRVEAMMMASPAIAIGGATAISNLVPAAIISANLVGFMGLVLAPFIIGFTVEVLNAKQIYLSLRNGSVKATIDQHGWNWSADPRNISDKKFSRLLHFISAGHSIEKANH